MNLKRNDPIFSTAKGLAATEKEIGMLLKSGAFVFEEVMEVAEVGAFIQTLFSIP